MFCRVVGDINLEEDSLNFLCLFGFFIYFFEEFYAINTLNQIEIFYDFFNFVCLEVADEVK